MVEVEMTWVWLPAKSERAAEQTGDEHRVPPCPDQEMINGLALMNHRTTESPKLKIVEAEVH